MSDRNDALVHRHDVPADREFDNKVAASMVKCLAYRMAGDVYTRGIDVVGGERVPIEVMCVGESDYIEGDGRKG